LLNTGPEIDLAEALDAPELTWTTGGDADWFGQTNTSYDGVDAAQSGRIHTGQESWMETTVTGPGTLTFWWKVSAQYNYYYLQFYINDALQDGRISGETDWQQKSYTLSSGTHSLRWRYNKSGVSNIDDTAWVDQVVWTPSEQTGSIQVFIEPPEAIAAGAQWRLTNDPDGLWRNSGDIATGLAPGNYTITFKDISGLNSPADMGVDLEKGENVTVDGP
jgi:hypothetical protein